MLSPHILPAAALLCHCGECQEEHRWVWSGCGLGVQVSVVYLEGVNIIEGRIGVCGMREESTIFLLMHISDPHVLLRSGPALTDLGHPDGAAQGGQSPSAPPTPLLPEPAQGDGSGDTQGTLPSTEVF